MTATVPIFVLDDWQNGPTRTWNEIVPGMIPCRLSKSETGEWRQDQDFSSRCILIVHYSALIEQCELVDVVGWLSACSALHIIVISGGSIPEDEEVPVHDRLFVRTHVHAPGDSHFAALFKDFLSVFESNVLNFGLLERAAYSGVAFRPAQEILLHFLPDYLSDAPRVDDAPEVELWDRLREALLLRFGQQESARKVTAFREIANRQNIGEGSNWYEVLSKELLKLQSGPAVGKNRST